jgi:hypothetical protein
VERERNLPAMKSTKCQMCHRQTQSPCGICSRHYVLVVDTLLVILACALLGGLWVPIVAIAWTLRGGR